MSRSPQVVEGLRGQKVPEKGVTVPIPKSSPVPPTVPGLVVLRSRYRNARVQLTSTMTHLDPATGRYLTTKPLFLQFFNHTATVDSKDPAGQEILKLAKAHPKFGLAGGGTFWLADEEVERNKDEKTQEVIEFLKTTDPENFQRAMAALGGSEFALPSKNEDGEEGQAQTNEPSL